MYTVLLVDDEISVIDSLRSAIPWTDLGIGKIYAAVDGIQALDYFTSHRIDLLIVDIKMPRMDGLELLKEVRSRYPDTHCILLTAYGEFEYARSAFRLGIEDYLLKPMQIREITKTIENSINNIYASRRIKEPLFRENFLCRWLNGNISGNELRERANLLDINVYQSSYAAICVKSDLSPSSLSSYGDTCARLLHRLCDCSSVWDNLGRYVLIVGGSSLSQKTLGDVLHKAAEDLHILEKINASIGCVVSGSEYLSVSYQDAVSLLKKGNRLSQSPILMKESDSPPSLRSLLPSIDYESLSPITRRALEYIHREYATGVSIKEFCANYTITPAYLGYLFKKETNIFFNNYLNCYRLEKAIELLNTSSCKISEIAAKTGFPNSSYFISEFRKHTGVTPQKYRENYENRKGAEYGIKE